MDGRPILKTSKIKTQPAIQATGHGSRGKVSRRDYELKDLKTGYVINTPYQRINMEQKM